MVMMNDLDRFHLVMDVIDRVPMNEHGESQTGAGEDVRVGGPASPASPRRCRGPNPRTSQSEITAGNPSTDATLKRPRPPEEPKPRTSRRVDPGPYCRELTLPLPVDGTMANVTYRNGILVVVLPLADATHPRASVVSNGRPRAWGACRERRPPGSPASAKRTTPGVCRAIIGTTPKPHHRRQTCPEWPVTSLRYQSSGSAQIEPDDVQPDVLIAPAAEMIEGFLAPHPERTNDMNSVSDFKRDIADPATHPREGPPVVCRYLRQADALDGARGYGGDTTSTARRPHG